MARVRAELEALAERVVKGQLKAPEKIGAAAGSILASNHGHRYYGWSYKDGVFFFFEHPVHFAREQAYEGKYIIQTEEPDLSPVEAVRLYQELSQVDIDQTWRLSRFFRSVGLGERGRQATPRGGRHPNGLQGFDRSCVSMN